MTNIEKYDQVFINSFHTNKQALSTLSYQGLDTWDSIGHMKMIATLEETFDIMIEMDDILDFSSYTKGFKIVEKYGIRL
jgi:acyl carrier protein